MKYRVAALTVSLILATGVQSHAAATEQSCAAAKAAAAGKKFTAIAKCHSKALKAAAPVDAECVSKAISKFEAKWAKIEGKGSCATTGDVDAVETKIDACVIDVVTDVTPPDCGNGIMEGPEDCDDGNEDDLDGCAGCAGAPVCNASQYPGGDVFSLDLDTGHCYVAYEDVFVTYDSAETACASGGGYLVSITDAAEDALVTALHTDIQVLWIGANDRTNEGAFEWVSGEPFSYSRFVPGQPDDGGGGPSEDCIVLANAAGQWSDQVCSFDVLASGWVCEYEP